MKGRANGNVKPYNSENRRRRYSAACRTLSKRTDEQENDDEWEDEDDEVDEVDENWKKKKKEVGWEMEGFSDELTVFGLDTKFSAFAIVFVSISVYVAV